MIAVYPLVLNDVYVQSLFESLCLHECVHMSRWVCVCMSICVSMCVSHSYQDASAS